MPDQNDTGGTAPYEGNCRLGDLALDLGRRQLSRNGQPIKLGRLSFDLLVELVKAAPNVVTHEELTDRVWGGRIVSPETITQRVKILRDALGDDANQPRYVLGIRGHGYRLVPEVVKIASDEAFVADGIGRQPKTSRVRLTAIMAIVAVAAAALASYWLTVREADEHLNKPSLAVLPFTNQSATEADVSFVSLGIQDEIITRLTATGYLRVISRTSAMAYQSSDKNIEEIAAELGVDHVLEGNVQRADDRMQISVRLTNAATGEHLWAESYAREFSVSNVFAVENDIARMVAGNLTKTLASFEEERTEELPTTNARAYEYYLRGKGYLARTGDVRTNLFAALALLENAVAEDDRFVEALAELSRVNSFIYWFSFDRSEPRSRQAHDAALAALNLNAESPLARLAMGQFHLFVRNDLDLALEELRLAQRGMPADSEVLMSLAGIHQRRGELTEGLALLEGIIENDPRNVNAMRGLAFGSLNLRRYDEASRWYSRVSDIAPDDVYSHVQLAWIPFSESGDLESLENVRTAVIEAPMGLPPMFRIQAQWLPAILLEDYPAALDALRGLEAETVSDQINYMPTSFFFAMTYHLMGDLEEAQPFLDTAEGHLRIALEASPDDVRIKQSLGQILAVIGRTREAERLAQDIATDAACNHGICRLNVVRILGLADSDAAGIGALRAYLENPGIYSFAALEHEPRLANLRDAPGYLDLAAEYR